ncbi:hypothetical protein [Sphingomonas quercus]|uniref:Uncharacterized protein n=1 Tax=Sphingomonas quercus TaxID=2842451 RepID=A0ABS6BHQ5_9SPHN|nr:hypothetical protein [Sphingomonas quercus]MBU3077833.1 hypothetical protein [Sphingomonas quercus]
MAELSALVRAPFEEEPDPRPEPLSSEQGLTLMQSVFASVDVVRYDDELRVTDPVDLLGYLSTLPIADQPDAMEKLAVAVDYAFSHAGGVFSITEHPNRSSDTDSRLIDPASTRSCSGQRMAQRAVTGTAASGRRGETGPDE